MGTWGPDAFANDNAMDWIGELSDEGTVREALRVADVPRDQYVEAPDGEIALAPAEVVAAALGRPLAPDMPDEVVAWIDVHGAGAADLRDQALAAIDRVMI